MTNKLVVINSLKVQKMKKILLCEIKFLVPNYSCLQNPWLRGYHTQTPVLSVLCPQLNLLNPPPTPNKIPRYTTVFMCNKYGVFRPDVSDGVLCASREAAVDSHFERSRSGVVFRALQENSNEMPGSGGRLRLPSLGTESTNSSGGGASQTQKEQHRVVFMG